MSGNRRRKGRPPAESGASVSAFAARQGNLFQTEDYTAALTCPRYDDNDINEFNNIESESDVDEQDRQNTSSYSPPNVIHHSRSLALSSSLDPSMEMKGSKWRWKTDSCLPFKLANGQAAAVVVLKGDESLGLVGYAEVGVIKGTADILGHFLAASEDVLSTSGTLSVNFHTVVSPRSSSVAAIRAKNSKLSVLNKSTENVMQYNVPKLACDFIRKQTKNLVSDACIVIVKDASEENSSIVQSIQDIVSSSRSYRHLFSLPSSMSKLAYGHCLELESCSVVPEVQNEMALFEAFQEWYALAADIATNLSPIVIVVGGKDVGKSTFSRFLVNRLLNSYPQVAYLDSDVGQCEFTPPGLTSLTLCDKPLLSSAAGFSGLSPDMCCFMGNSTPKSDPFVYVRGVRELMKRYHVIAAEMAMGGATLPLVINTHGWIKGVGLELVTKVISIANPTHVVQFIHEPSYQGNLNALAMPYLTSEYLESTTANLMRARLESSDHDRPVFEQHVQTVIPTHSLAIMPPCTRRTIISSKYTNADLRQISFSKYFSCDGKTYSVPISHVSISIMNEDVSPENVLYAINGCLIGLVSGSRDQNVCEGLGIVKGVDIATMQLQIFTPVSWQRLQTVNRIMRGALNLSDGFIDNSIVKMPGSMQPYKMSTATTKALGSALRKSRTGLVRRKNIAQ
eukprot:CFRG8075T1